VPQGLYYRIDRRPAGSESRIIMSSPQHANHGINSQVRWICTDRGGDERSQGVSQQRRTSQIQASKEPGDKTGIKTIAGTSCVTRFHGKPWYVAAGVLTADKASGLAQLQSYHLDTLI
jgi:hypothetical protein